MRQLRPAFFALILGLVSEAFLASIVVVCDMAPKMGQIVSGGRHIPAWFLVVLWPHYPGLVLSGYFHLHPPTDFWLSVVLAVFLLSLVWRILMIRIL